MKHAKLFVLMVATLLCCVEVKAAPTDLPQMTTNLENPVYYTISNTRSTSGRYLYYAGDNVGLKDADEITDASLFYFTGTTEACYIHNAATTKMVASPTSWTDDGVAWTIGVTPYGDGTTGLCIGLKGSGSVVNCWNEFTHNDAYALYAASDAGSVFVVELYGDVPGVPETPEEEESDEMLVHTTFEIPEGENGWIEGAEWYDENHTLVAYTSPTYHARGTVESFRITVNRNKQGRNFFALSELAVYDADGREIELTEANVTSNADHNALNPGNTDGGGIPALFDDDVTTYFHSTWIASSSDGGAHYLEITLPNGGYDTFSFRMISRKNQEYSFPAEMITNMAVSLADQTPANPDTPNEEEDILGVHITTLADADPTKCYTITTMMGRGAWTVDDAGRWFTCTRAEGFDVDATDARQQFAILSLNAVDFYLYSVSAQKFVKKDGSLVAGVGDAIEFIDASSMEVGRVMVRFDENHIINVSDVSRCVEINNWNTLDAGNAVLIAEAGDFDASEALAMLSAPSDEEPDEFGNVISRLEDADPTKYYTIATTARGAWAVNTEGTYFSTTGVEEYYIDAEDARQQFAILSLNAVDFYLYSVSAKKFVKSDRTLATGIGDAIEFVDASSIEGGRVMVRFRDVADANINIGGDNQMTIDSWGTIDGGNAVLIAEAGDFDATEALAALADPETAEMKVLIAQAEQLLAAHANNHAAVPAIGQYATAAYEALALAIGGDNISKESVEAAIAAFEDSKCLPVFTIDGVYSYVMGMSIYEPEDELLWKETDYDDHSMLWAFDITETTVGVTDRVVVKNVATGKLFDNAYFVQITETEENIADDGIFLIYPEGMGHPLHALSNGGFYRFARYSVNSTCAWKFTYVGTTYDIKGLPDDDEPADDCTITYEFAHNGQVLYTQESVVALGSVYPDYNITFPFGVTAAAKPEGMVSESETVGIALTISLPIEYAESYEEIGDNWHYLTIHATQKNYLYYDPSLDYLDVTKTGVDTTNVDAYAWAFVGNPIEGFKIVNKLAGQDKSLCLGERYSYMGEESYLFTLEGSSHSGGFIIPTGVNSQYLNKYMDKLGYWGYPDNGCVFFMTDEMGAITPVVPEVPKAWYDVVVHAGENGIVDGGGNFEEGTRVSVSATPNAGYRFAGWSNGSTANPYEFTVRGAVELTAEFEALPHPGEMLIPFGQFTHEPWPVKYFRADMDSDVTPGTNWYAPDFDDSSWITAEAPITNVRYKFYTATFWEPLRSTYWVRRTFNLESIPQDRTFVLYVSHDDECTMYLNGHEIFETTGWTETYKAVKMDDEFASYLVDGENVITAVVTNSGLNHACVDFGIYHVEKEAEVIQPKRSVMVYAGAYSRCILEDHVIEPNDSLTLSGAFEDGETIRLVFEPLEGYRVLSMKRNGEVVAIHNNVYEERAFEDVMFTDVTYEAPAPKVWYDVVVLAGENGTVDGGGNYEEGTRVSVSATPNAGYRFAGWSNGSNANPYEFTVGEAVELTAEFEALPHPGEMLIPFGQFTHEPWPVKYFRADMYSGVAPDTCWYTPDFDDSSWTSAEAPITNVRYKFYTATFWEPLRSTYWVRRTFNLDSIPQNRDFVLYVSHDDECTMYLNGHKIFEATGWTETYKAVAMNDEFASYLVEGENVMTAVVTNSGLNHACVDFGIYHIEKGEEVVQPKRSVMAYAGAYGRCALNDHIIEANDSLTLSSAYEDGDAIRLVFEPFEGYNVVSMKRNGEFVAINNNVYEELAFEDVMFTDVTYEVNVPLEIIGMEPDSVPVAKVDYLTLTFNEEVIFTLPDEGITVTGINTGEQFVITQCFVHDRYDGTFKAYMYFKLESGEYDEITVPDTYVYTIPAGAIQSVDGDELPETTITFTVVGSFSLVSFSPAETTCLDKIELTFDEEVAEAVIPWYGLPVYDGVMDRVSVVNNILIGEDKHVVTLELSTPIVEPGEYYFHIFEGVFIAEGGMRSDTASMTFVVVEDSIEVPDTTITNSYYWSGIYKVKADSIDVLNEGFPAFDEFEMQVVYDQEFEIYRIIKLFGYDVAALNRDGGIVLTPMGTNPNQAEIATNGSYLLDDEANDACFCLRNADLSTNPVIITRLDDGTFAIDDFSISYNVFDGTDTPETPASYYQGVTAERVYSEMPIEYMPDPSGWIEGTVTYIHSEEDYENFAVGYSSPMYRFEEKVETFRIEVYYDRNYRSFFSLSELEVYDSTGTKIELTAENVRSNADHNALNPGYEDGGGIPALFDGDRETYFHSAWRNVPSQNHYLEITLPNGGYDAFSFRMISRPRMGNNNHNYTFPGAMVLRNIENPSREALVELLDKAAGYYPYSFPEAGYYSADLSYLREAMNEAEELLNGSASVEEYEAAAAALSKAIEEFETSGDNAVRLPEAGKVYHVVSAFPGFYEHQSVEKTLSISDDSTRVIWWENLDTDNALQEFVFEPVLGVDGVDSVEIWSVRYGDGTIETETYYPYYMKHVATGLFVGYVGGVGFRFVEEQSVMRLVTLNDGQFNIVGFENIETGGFYIHSAHAVDHNNGYPSDNIGDYGGTSGMSSCIFPWSGGHDTPSAWYIREYVELPYTANVTEGESEFVHFEATNTLTLTADKACSFDDLVLYDRYGNEIAIDTLIVSGNTATIAQAKNLVACSFAFNNVEGVSSVILNTLGAPEGEGMLGDVNGDGYYTMADVVMMVNAVLEKPQANFNANVADMNGDGAITMSDVVSVLRLVLTDGESMAPARRVQRSAMTLPELSAMELTAVDDNHIVLPVALSNSEAYSAFQLDVVLPKGVELAEATLTGRAKATHAVAWNTLSDGSVRVVAYAMNNATFRGNEGELLNLVLTTTDKLGSDAEIVLTDGLFATVDGAEHRAADVNVQMRVTSDIDDAYAVSFQAYGVEEGVAIECGVETVVRIYAATGQLVQQTIVEKGKSIISLPAGMYMVNGNKVIVK